MERGHLYQQWDVYMAIARDLSTEQIQEVRSFQCDTVSQIGGSYDAGCNLNIAYLLDD